MNNNELTEIVCELNECLPKKLENVCNAHFVFWSCGWQSCILFSEILLWDDCNEERPFDEEKNEYAISIKDYVIERYKELVENMGKADFNKAAGQLENQCYVG